MSLYLDQAEGPPLIIRERTGRKRAVTLRGRALPHRSGPSWSITQRHKRTGYAGNPVATMQLLGASFDKETTFSGVWRDRYMIEGDVGAVATEGFAPVTSAEACAAVFEDLVRSGSELEVTWSHLRRVGILAEFTQRPDRPEDIGWEMVFQWVGDLEAVAVPRRPEGPTASVSLAKAAAAMQETGDHAAFGPLDMLSSFSAKVFQAVSNLESKVTDMLQQARSVASLARAPAQLVQGVRASATSIAMLSGQLIEETIGAGHETTQAADDVASVCTAEAWRRELAFWLGQLRHEAYAAARALEKQEDPDALVIVTMDASGSLRALAQKYYGRADAWVTIAKANGFDYDPYVPPGTEVIVPPSGGGS